MSNTGWEKYPVSRQAPHSSLPLILVGQAGAPADTMCVDLKALCVGRDRPLPFVLRIVMENLARAALDDPDPELIDGLGAVAAWNREAGPITVRLDVTRLVVPDSSGLPALMDLAALRGRLARIGKDPSQVEPVIPVDLVIDHSLMVDRAGASDAQAFNEMREFHRNRERYAFFKWAQQAFRGLRVVPPGMGIIHQVHLEYLARSVHVGPAAGHARVVSSEFVLGCDSHTPMVNALGILGWGVGGIEGEAALLGEKYAIEIPRVVGVRLTGALGPGVSTTDLVLHITERLRTTGVVGDFVEFCGPGLDALAVPDRATIANMAPEYGATCGFFPFDAAILHYLVATGRPEDHLGLVEAHARATGLFREPGDPEPEFSEIVEIDLGAVVPSVAGPHRPQDRLSLPDVPAAFRQSLTRAPAEGGFSIAHSATETRVVVETPRGPATLGHGSIVIAAITSCTNTSNPSLMVAAGLLARNAAERGLRPPAHVKTSLAPGSRVVSEYLAASGLSVPLEALGFHVVGYGCTTCSGKSGPIAPVIETAIHEDGLVACAVLSGNRNFEGRIHKALRAAYLASPALVIAYALAGRIDVDFEKEALGQDQDGKRVFLRDIWPEDAEISTMASAAHDPDTFRRNYAHIFEGTDLWQKLQAPRGQLFPWSEASTYIKEPPFFSADFMGPRVGLPDALMGARALAVFGDSLTTDHITPSGEIAEDTLAGRYLAAEGVRPADFNAYTQRRGNHEVLARATFANPRIRNLMVPNSEGGVTLKLPEGERMAIHTAAAFYRTEGVPLIVLAGKDYGMGSSRDWAAKGPALLGVRAVIAEGFERIHRSNLIGLGIVPLVFEGGAGWRELGLDGTERFDLAGLAAGVHEATPINVLATDANGRRTEFVARAAVSSAAERSLLEAGGVFLRIFRKFADQSDGETPRAAGGRG